MSVWVVVASKYGATREIADAIAEELRAAHLEVELKDATEVASFDGADAVVLGSAVYVGHWLKPARDLLEGSVEQLASIPAWLFSSGPIGDPPEPEEAEPEGIAEPVKSAGVRGHQVFAGKLDHEALGPLERLMVKALKAPDGDFRDWDAIRVWARSIAADLGS